MLSGESSSFFECGNSYDSQGEGKVTYDGILITSRGDYGEQI